MVYEWRMPVHKKVSAQSAGEHIEELTKTHGEVTPQILLDDSRPSDALLHPLYEWDDVKAAEKYRLNQSRDIIGNLMIVNVETKESSIPPVPIRAFVSVNDRNSKASYMPTIMALSEEKTREQVIANAKAELRMFEAKYRNLIDTVSVIREYLEEKEKAS